MVKVNLLQSVQVAADSEIGTTSSVGGDIESEKRQGLMKLVVIVLPVVAAIFAQNEYVIKGKKRRLAHANRELRKYQEINQQQGSLGEEIQRIRDEEAQYRARIKVIDGLSENRSLLIKTLDAIQTLIPERVWLTGVRVRGKSMVLGGYAVSDIQISNFMQSLQDSIFFSNISLTNTSEAKLRRGNFKQFEVICDIRGN